MSQPFGSDAADDLVRLWQESRLPAPDPERLARRAAWMTLARFDRAIRRRNLSEYAGFVVLLVLCGWIWMSGGDRVQVVASVGGGLFVVSYLAWQHRRLTPVDPSADARTYQAALLARIDRQIALLRGTRHWYLLPLYLPLLRTVAVTWDKHPWAALVFWLAVTCVFVLIGWLNEGVAVNRLKEERARVASLYDDEEP